MTLLVCLAGPLHAAHGGRVDRTHGHQPGVRGATNGRAPGYLGIGFRDVPDDQLAALNLKGTHGVEVILVDHDGPAGKAGLRPHDVIVALNGQAVAGSKALSRMIHDSGAGFALIFNVLREGHTLTFSTKLADREALERETLAHLTGGDAPETAEAPVEATVAAPVPAPPAQPPPDPAPRSPGFINSVLHSSSLNYTGLTCDRMEPQLAVFFGSPAGTGLLVHTVEPGSPAAAAGVRAGDVILRVDGQPIRTGSDWTKHIHNAKGRPVSLTVLRDRHESTMALQPGLKHHSMVEWPKLF